MRSLLPRILDETGEWLDTGLSPFATYPIRVEDYREKDRYVVRAELPGLDPEHDIKVSVDDGVLTIEAERSEGTTDRHRTEFRYGSLHRSVRLPAGADDTGISARYDKGILEVTVPLRRTGPAGHTVPIEHSG